MKEKREIGKNTTSDLLTQHFFLYISHIKRAFDRSNQCMDKTIVQVLGTNMGTYKCIPL